MGYFGYYAAWMLLAYVVQYPPLLVGLVVIFLLRRYVPDPFVLFRTMGRISALRRQIEANPSNVTARRDLASIYLERLRPGAALALLEPALARFPSDAELLYLKGVAHVRRGEHEMALAPLVRAVGIDARLRFGQPYLAAGDALRALGRKEEALDSYERFVRANSSSIEGHLKLSRAHTALGDTDAAKKSLDEAIATWSQVPSYARRNQLGWWLRAHFTRLLGV